MQLLLDLNDTRMPFEALLPIPVACRLIPFVKQMASLYSTRTYTCIHVVTTPKIYGWCQVFYSFMRMHVIWDNYTSVRACAQRHTVVCLCVCLSVCLSVCPCITAITAQRLKCKCK